MGWPSSVDPDTGQFIGFLEDGADLYFLATMLEKEESQISLGVIKKGITPSTIPKEVIKI